MTAPGATRPYALPLDRSVDHAAERHGDTRVVTGGGRDPGRVDYAALRARGNRLSGALPALGLRPADDLAMPAWNTQARLGCWHGVTGVGIVRHTPDSRLTPARLADMAAQAGGRVLAANVGLAPLVEGVVARCPTVEHVLLLEEQGDERPAPDPPGARVRRQADLVAELGRPAPWSGFGENAPAGLCLTSGTTGTPRGSPARTAPIPSTPPTSRRRT